MSHVAAESRSRVYAQRQTAAAKVGEKREEGSHCHEEAIGETWPEWYPWWRHHLPATAACNNNVDGCRSESVTTVYAVKTAIRRKHQKESGKKKLEANVKERQKTRKNCLFTCCLATKNGGDADWSDTCDDVIVTSPGIQDCTSLTQSPCGWSHVANPSRCLFCQSEHQLSLQDVIAREPTSLQLAALTFARQRDIEDQLIASRGHVGRVPDSAVQWLDSADSQTHPGGSGWISDSYGSFSEESSSVGSLELSDTDVFRTVRQLECSPRGQRAISTQPDRRYRYSVQQRQEPIRYATAWNNQLVVAEQTTRVRHRPHDDDRRRLSLPSPGDARPVADRLWVVRRRSDGSRYIRRRHEEADPVRRRAADRRRSDPARRSQQPLTSNRRSSRYAASLVRDSPGAERRTLEVLDASWSFLQSPWTGTEASDYADTGLQWTVCPRSDDAVFTVVAVV